MPTPSWGLVLSGGAAWGLANLGVLEVLEREGLKPDCIAGSSMGAIVGALYALGYSTKDLHALVQDIKPVSIATLSEKALKGGLHGGLLRQRLDEHLRPLVGDATIGDCKIPFVCVAGRVKEPIPWHRILSKEDFTPIVAERVERHVFSPETKIIDALLASSAIPVVFSPVKIAGDEFVDLIAFGAIPARTLKAAHSPDILIATDCNPVYEGVRKMLPPGWRSFVEAGVRSYKESQDVCDLILHPAFTSGPFRFDKSLDFVRAGKSVAEEAVTRIKKLVS